MYYTLCSHCRGTGKIKDSSVTQPCPTCQGTGIISPAEQSTAKPSPELAPQTNNGNGQGHSPLLVWLLGLMAMLSVAGLVAALVASHSVSVNINNINAGNGPPPGCPPPGNPPPPGAPPPPPGCPMSPPSATATIADVPKLSLVPTRLTAQNCASASAQLTVKNAGTGTLHWSAKPASQTGYGIVPDHGALTAGRGQS